MDTGVPLACTEAQILTPTLAAMTRPGDEERLRITVLLVDTQTLFRTGMASLLSEDERLVVAGMSDGDEGVPELCASRSVDIVLTDIEVRQWNAVALTRAIAKASPSTRVLILASRADWRVIPAMASGAAGFLVKDAQPEAVRAAVLSAYLGEQVLCAEAARWLIQDRPDYRLTRRERDVLRLVAEGAGNKEIAELLHLGDKTVRNYVSRVYRKLAMHNRADITSVAFRSDAVGAPFPGGPLRTMPARRVTGQMVPDRSTSP